jgi:hypothetical protein
MYGMVSFKVTVRYNKKASADETSERVEKVF